MCRLCGKEIVRRSPKAAYCSMTCCSKWHALKRAGRVDHAPPPPCGTCGGSLGDRPAGSRFCSVKCKNAHHNAKQDGRLRKYGISAKQFAAMAEAGCRVCGSTDDLVVDHDHQCCSGSRTCGQCVRGVLCRNCNGGIGLLGESPDRLLAAAAYILSTLDVLQGA